MLKSKHIDLICIAVTGLAVLLVLLFMNGERLGLRTASSAPGYETRLFDPSRVHTIDIRIDDWEGFLESASQERYTSCTLVIDGETFEHVGLRAKGNNSLRLTEKYGHDRYSLKLEFDHFTHNSYYGLDKFSLDSAFQDNSYLKNRLAFDMMAFMGVPTPLCSWVWVQVNAEDWGLFLAIEEPEDAFAARCFGQDHGQLYKPDYKSLSDENADVHLRYTPDGSYDNIFRKAKFNPTAADRARLIDALRRLSSGEDPESAVDIEEVLRYFTVQVFVVNLDSYLGRTGHNYFLYEEDGRLQILPWDYNLAFGTYALGMPDPVNDATRFVNHPIDTPASWEVMQHRPLYHNLMLHDHIFARYHELFDLLIADYFESGYFTQFLDREKALIAPYTAKDPTAFCSPADWALAVDTLREFCLLRAQSIRGQLSGEIPSTIAGQQQDSSAFIDASGLWLPDLGEIADLKDGIH